MYRSAIVVTSLLKKTGFGGIEILYPDFPVEVFGGDVARDGRIVTHLIDRIEFEGYPVICKIDVRVEDFAAIEALPGYIGTDPAIVCTDPRYLEHWPQGGRFCAWETGEF